MGGHCSHCKGEPGTCGCARCPRRSGSKCTQQHCHHCKGASGLCACTSGCSKPGYARCVPQQSTRVAVLAGRGGGLAVAETTSIQPTLAVSVNLINCWFVVDCSGSMAGSSWNKACAGVLACLSQLTDNDYCGLIAFNDEVKVIDCDRKCKLNARKFKEVRPNGGTKLYDAIAKAIGGAMQVHQALDSAVSVQVLTYVIILTDGADTGSALSLRETQALLVLANRMRNLKIIMAGVNLTGTAKSAMRDLGSVGDDDIRSIDLQSSSDIENLFEHIGVELRARAVTETRVLAFGS